MNTKFILGNPNSGENPAKCLLEKILFHEEFATMSEI